METIWYFVILFAANGVWFVDPLQPPVPNESQQACMDLAVSQMVDTRRSEISINCIEADDEEDLHKILLKNFNFGQDRGDAV